MIIEFVENGNDVHRPVVLLYSCITGIDFFLGITNLG